MVVSEAVSEANVKQEIVDDNCNGLQRIYNNLIGLFFAGKVKEERRAERIVTLQPYQRVEAGWPDGSFDLSGFKSVVITPDMVGKRVAILVSIEVKKPDQICQGRKIYGGVISQSQLRWYHFLKQAGAICGFCDSSRGAKMIIDKGLD